MLFFARFNLGNGEGLLECNASRIDDGLWHRIRATRYNSEHIDIIEEGPCNIFKTVFYRNEQTASLRVDNGPLVTGASPGKLRQLNGNGQVYLGKFAHACVYYKFGNSWLKN